MLQRIIALIYKEILAVWRDKKSRMVLIFPPLFQLLIFAWAATLDVKNVHMGILNRDNGEQGIELTQRFNGSPTFSKITYLRSVEEIAPFIDNQEGMMVLSIDEQFSRNLDANKNADVQLIFDGRRSNTTQIVAGYASNVIQQFNRDFAKKYNIPQQRTAIVPRNWFNPNLIYTWFNVPNLSGVLTMLVGLIVTSLSIARERELGTFDQLLVSPLLPIEILIGKSIPAIIIGMIEGSIIIAAAVFIFGVPLIGTLWYLYLGMFVFICSIVGVGLFISSLSATQQQAILGGFIFMAPAVLLSGYATPIENMPSWLQTATYANPLRYYLVIAKGVFLKDMPLYIVLSQVWPMIIIAFFTLSLSTWFFRHKLE
ncbi:MAG: ABC transporter permease [Parachlamydiaceae bacterium]|nr:MAG: ABC transporter permease [Parachlamydiaceae bacterium]